jgi:hypothetical protein
MNSIPLPCSNPMNVATMMAMPRRDWAADRVV